MSEVRSFFERWQRLEESKAEIAEDLKELFAEAKSRGFKGGEDVDRSASARPSGQELIGAQPSGVEDGIEQSVSGPDVKRASYSASAGAHPGRVVTSSGGNDADEISPRIRKPLRPHCLEPDACVGSGANHCFRCRKAMQTSEVAA